MTTDINSPLLQFAQFSNPRQRVEVKSVWDDDAGWVGVVDRDDDAATAKFYKGVPWLYRGVEMRANAVASVPFQLVRNSDAIDTSDEWKDTTGLLPDPYRLLWLLEASLCFGPAYLWREGNRVKRLPLKHIAASTITPEIDSVLGLTGFVRSLGTKRIHAKPEDVVYFWKPDYQVELGPPLVSPAAAAMAAANVLWSLDQFTASFWARGAIRATLLTVEGAPQKSQIEELKRWWQKAVSGVKNAFAANVINASAVKPVVIGDGLDSLQNNDLTTKQREDISTALGIPFSVMNSTSAGGLGGGGVVHQDEIHFYDKTVRPECNFIAGVLNAQVFGPLGLRFEFLLDSLDVFQEDEHQRADAFRVYVEAGLPLEVAGLMLGLELPEGWTWERITAEKTPQAQPADEAGSGEQVKEIMGYHIETGIVTRNEARGSLGLPPVDETEDAAMQALRAQLDTMVVAKNAGIPLDQAANLVGLPIEAEEPEPEPIMPLAGSGAPQPPPAQPPDDEDEQDDQPAQPNPFAPKAMLDDLRAWRRKSQKRGKLADFESDAIPAAVMDTVKAHSVNGWLEALDAAIEGAQPTPANDELTAFERVAIEYAKAAGVFAQVLNGNGTH